MTPCGLEDVYKGFIGTYCHQRYLMMEAAYVVEMNCSVVISEFLKAVWMKVIVFRGMTP